MMKRGLIIIMTLFSTLLAKAEEYPYLLNLQAYDSSGRTMHTGHGILVEKGFVITNYHLISGADKIEVWFPSQKMTRYEVNGYLAVEPEKDLILISAPGMNDQFPLLSESINFKGGETFTFPEFTSGTDFNWRAGILKGAKTINNIRLMQIISKDAETVTRGPVFHEGRLVGMIAAGFWDEKYYAYALPVTELIPLITRSFIIKDIKSLDDYVPMEESFVQQTLIESLTRILWMSFEDAVRMTKKNKKPMFVNIYADWNGWCRLMDQNTYATKSIIRYANENFNAVRLNAEATDTIVFDGRYFVFDEQIHSHQLAYSLLNGKMEYPATAFLDEELNLLLVVPGYIEKDKMQVILHYFREKAYLKEGMSFSDYEKDFLQREE